MVINIIVCEWIAFSDFFGFWKCHRPFTLTLAPLFVLELLKTIQETSKFILGESYFGKRQPLKYRFFENEHDGFG